MSAVNTTPSNACCIEMQIMTFALIFFSMITSILEKWLIHGAVIAGRIARTLDHLLNFQF